MQRFKDFRELIDFSASEYSDRNAFIVKHGKEYDYIKYKRFREETRALGKYMLKHNRNDKRIAVIGQNSYGWMLVYLSVLCAGGVIVPLDKGLFKDEIAEQLSRAEADIIFYSSEMEDIVPNHDGLTRICMDSEEFENIMREGAALDNDGEYDKIVLKPKDMSILLFTSGTTSISKAVMLSQDNILSNIYQMTLCEKFYPTDVNLAILPFHHTFGMTEMIIFISHGMCNVFCEGLRIAKALKEYNVTMLVVVPRIAESMRDIVLKKLKARGQLEKVEKAIKLTGFLRKIGIDIRRKIFKEIIDGMGGLRMIIIGAAAADYEVLKWFNNIGILTVQGYGLTETSPCIAAENERYMRKASVGKPIPGVEVKIDKPDSDGIGEILAKGDNVMLGYYKDEENTNKVFKDGYFCTGDMGYFDKDGYLYITGRKKNVIVLANGKNVFPEEIEMLLSQCDAIKECIVYNNKNGGKDCIYAKIVYNTDDFNADEARKLIDEYIKQINEHLVSYKQIKGYDMTDIEMEKTTTLKIKR